MQSPKNIYQCILIYKLTPLEYLFTINYQNYNFCGPKSLWATINVQLKQMKKIAIIKDIFFN